MIYQFKYRSPETVVELVDILLEGRGKIFVDNESQSLIISAPPSVLKEIKEQLKQIDDQNKPRTLSYTLYSLKTLDIQDLNIKFKAWKGQQKKTQETARSLSFDGLTISPDFLTVLAENGTAEKEISGYIPLGKTSHSIDKIPTHTGDYSVSITSRIHLTSTELSIAVSDGNHYVIKQKASLSNNRKSYVIATATNTGDRTHSETVPFISRAPVITSRSTRTANLILLLSIGELKTGVPTNLQKIIDEVEKIRK